jgi:hypothetical protein
LMAYIVADSARDNCGQEISINFVGANKDHADYNN